MKHLWKYLILFFIGISVQNGYACKCSNYFKDIKDVKELEHYAFIALVKITDEKVTSKTEPMPVGHLGFDIIELFKGEPLKQVMEQGVGTSCDIGIERGEEWLLFATMQNGSVSVNACERSVRHKDLKGFREWRFRAYEDLQQVRKLYSHKVKTYGTEKRTEYYSNGQIEIEENYLSGKLNGERKIWYPNGVLFGKHYYQKDTLHGKSEWFYPSGQIEKEDYFINGKNAHVSRFYYDSVVVKSSKSRLIRTKTDESLNSVPGKVQPWYETVYDSYGRVILSREYNQIGKIRNEDIIDPDRNFVTSIYYHDNGLISNLSYRKNSDDYGHYIRYDKKGMPSREWDYDEKGRVIKK